MDFKDYLKDKLASSGQSVRDFTQKAQISRPLAYFYLQGKRLPTPKAAGMIAAALGVDAADFIELCRDNLGRPKNSPAAVTAIDAPRSCGNSRCFVDALKQGRDK